VKALFALAGLVALLAVGCSRGRASVLTVAGSTSVQPFAELVAEEYMRLHPGLTIVVQGGGSTAGIQAVREGAAVIGTVSRPLYDEEKDLLPVAIARDGIAIVVHPSNPLGGVTRQQARDLFAGLITDFSQVGGQSGPVRVVTREEGSGTRGAFQELIMDGSMITDEAIVQDSNGSMREVVAHDPCAIGYISLGLVDESVKALSIDGVAATRENVKSGAYPYSRPFLFVLKGQAQGNAKDFIDFTLGKTAQQMLEQEGLIAVD
jgi:phosphate transport system substrate-binding protein